MAWTRQGIGVARFLGVAFAAALLHASGARAVPGRVVTNAADLTSAVNDNAPLIYITNHIDLRELTATSGVLSNPAQVVDMAIWGNCSVTETDFADAKRYSGIPSSLLQPGSTACGLISDTHVPFIRNGSRLFLSNLIIHSPFPLSPNGDTNRCEAGVSTENSALWLVDVVVAGCLLEGVVSQGSSVTLINSWFVANNLPLYPSPSAFDNVPQVTGAQEWVNWTGQAVYFLDGQQPSRHVLLVTNTSFREYVAGAPAVALTQGPIHITVGYPTTTPSGSVQPVPQNVSVVLDSVNFDGPGLQPGLGCSGARGVCFTVSPTAVPLDLYSSPSSRVMYFAPSMESSVRQHDIGALTWADLYDSTSYEANPDNSWLASLYQAGVPGPEKAYGVLGLAALPPKAPTDPSAAPPPAASPPATPPLFVEVVPPVSDSKGSISRGALIGIIVAVVVAAVLILCLSLFLCFSRVEGQGRQKHDVEAPLPGSSGGSDPERPREPSADPDSRDEVGRPAAVEAHAAGADGFGAKHGWSSQRPDRPRLYLKSGT